MQFKYKEVKEIIKWTPKELKNKQISSLKNTFIGYYSKSSANWSYQVYVVEYNNILIKVATAFGSIE